MVNIEYLKLINVKFQVLVEDELFRSHTKVLYQGKSYFPISRYYSNSILNLIILLYVEIIMRILLNGLYT